MTAKELAKVLAVGDYVYRHAHGLDKMAAHVISASAEYRFRFRVSGPHRQFLIDLEEALAEYASYMTNEDTNETEVDRRAAVLKRLEAEYAELAAVEKE